MNQISIHINNLKVKQQGNVVLDGISFGLLPGQHLAITGASGSGKTTLSKTIAGHLFHEGSIIIKEENSNETPFVLFVEHRNEFKNLSNQSNFYYQQLLLRRLALVSDDVFGYLCRHHLEICARVAIKDSTGIVDHGPWTEELIPGETVLCGIVQDRGTTVRTRKSESPNTARNIDEDGFEKDEKEPDVALAALRKLLSKPKVLRLGSHASLGLGRACVPLVTKLPGEETRQ